MTDLYILLLKGISLGCLYALSAMGFVLLFKTGRIINLAHGQIMAMGAFIFLLLNALPGNTATAAFLLTLLTGLFILFVIERLFIRPLNHADMKQGIFVSAGILLMLKGLTAFIPPAPAERASTGASISPSGVVILVTGICLVLIFLILFRRSSFGLYIRAVSDNRKAAMSLGIPIKRLFTFSWAIAGTAALVSGILMAAGSWLNAFDPGTMESKIFPAIILGGLGSMRGAVLGGLLIGILEVCAGGRSSGPLGDLFPYLILIMILVARPNGLFSDKIDLAGIKE